MSWFQALRDDFTLRPFEIVQTHSESSAMASGPPDVMANQEAAEAAEECSGKKKSKFQTFKKFFARKKRKEPSASGADAALKGSQSTDNISKTSENNTLTHSEKEKGSGSKISLGSKALSHDSVFVSDSSEANEALGASQDSIHGKVKSLQLQLKQAIRLGSPPSLMCVKRTEDMGTMSEDDGLPCSPPEYAAHTALAQVQGNSSISLDGTDSDEDQLSCAASSRAVSPLVVVPGDFSQPASPFACLDNSAAKHKLGLRHKACNKRKPATRLELRAEGDSAVEDILNSSISEAVEENNEQKVKDASADEFKPEEEEEEEEEEEKEQAEHSRQFLLSDKEEREESSSEPEAEQDVSDGPGTSCPPETGLSEEEATDAQPSASSETGSGASSLDSPRGTPEPPAGQREYLMDPPGTTYGTEEEEKRDQSDSVLGLTGGEDGEQETEEEEGESSFLQEVLSSLKTPLNSPLVETESIVLELEQEEVKNREEEKEEEEEEEKKAETEEGEGVEAEDEDEDEDVEEPVIYQAVVSGSSISDQNTKGEEEEVTTTTASYNEAKEEMKHVEEEEEDDSTEKEEEEEEEEELIVEHFSQYDQVEEVQKEDVEKTEEEEENSLHVTQTDNQMEEKEEKKMEEEEEEEEGEEEEEAKELEQEHEAKGEKLEETVEHNKEDDVEVEEKNEEVEEPEEAKEDEEEDAEEKMLSDADGGKMVVDPEETVDDINTVNKDETEYETDGDKILPGQEEDVFDMFHESQKAFDQMEPTEQNLDQEDAAASEPNVEESRSQQDEEQETKQEKEQSNMDTTVSSRPSSLILPQTPTTPSKTSTIHINLVSPSAEKFASCFPLPPSTVEAKKSMSTVEEPGDKEEKAEEEEATQHSDAATASNKEAKLSAPVDETSKVRFTITPAWQRLLSTGEKDSPILHSSPPASIFSSSATGGTEVVTMEEPLEKAESVSSAKAEVMLSPSRAKNAEMTTPKPQWNTSPTPESSVVLEGNSNNPFGVRLRKTSALHCFSSEEENAEPVHESAPQLSSCTADSLQPLSIKPSGSQPISNKPALPKKPEVTGDGGGKAKRILDPTAARSGSDPPSWISVAKQKQKVYKENPLDNTAVQKEEQERKSSLPMSSSSNKTPESSSKVSLLELNKSSAPVEKESRRSLSPPTPVPPQPAKSLSLPFPVPPKPNVTTSTTPKPSPQRSLSPPTPVPVGQRPPSCMSPLSTSKPAPSLPTGNMTLTSPPFSSRTTPAQSAGSSPTPAAQRGVPSPALSQDEPPWMALAKKKAKAWSEMPQIVQ